MKITAGRTVVGLPMGLMRPCPEDAEVSSYGNFVLGEVTKTVE